MSSPPQTEILEQLQRLNGSRHLRESTQLQHFLEFITRETIEGRADGLKEYSLGCRVFGRRADYDPRHDGIVRVQATALRKRLQKYYDEDGLSDLVIINLPRGGYVPTFAYREAEPAPAVVDEPPPPPSPPMHWTRPFAGGVLVTFALCTALWLVWPRPSEAYRITTATPTDCPALWGPFFDRRTETVIGIGVPLFYSMGGFYVRDVRVNRTGQPDNSRIEAVSQLFKTVPLPNDNTYTGLGEAVGANRISTFLTTDGVPVRVMSAHSFGESILQNRNLIIVSSLRFQSLLNDLRLPSTFRFEGTQPEKIRNLHPLAGEREEYSFVSGAGVSTSYALVCLWPGLSPNRRILFVGGVHTWATQAATEFVLNAAQLRKLTAEMRRTPKGPPSPFFQVLLKVEGREDQPLSVDYVTHRYLPADSKVTQN